MTSFDHVPVEEFRVNFMWDIVRAPTFKNSINFLVVQNVHLDPKIRSQSSGLSCSHGPVGDCYTVCLKKSGTLLKICAKSIIFTFVE